MEAKDYIIRLNEILEQKIALLVEISGYTSLQKEALQNGNSDELEILIAKKQARIEAIDRFDEQFSVYSSRLKDLLGIKKFEELPKHHIPGTKELQEKVTKVYELLNSIKAIDQENTGKLSSDLLQVKEKIKQNNSFKKVNNAYNSPVANNQNHYFDKKK